MTEKICFIDFETTGIDVFRDEPIELGAILVDEKLDVIRRFSSRIKVEKKIRVRKSALAIHHTHLEELAYAPTQKEMLRDYFSQFGTEYRFAGWNINFDVSFFRKLCNKNGFMVQYNRINHRHLDIQSVNFIANKLRLYSNSCKSLSDLAKYFQLNRDDKHSALQDAELVFKVYEKLIALFKHQLK